MRIYSWNVNGIRAVVRKELWQPFLTSEKPDIICLQELKAKADQFDLAGNGYHTYYHSADKPGYSGVAIISKIKPLSVQYNLPTEIIKKYPKLTDAYGDASSEGRVITAEFTDFYLISTYFPNAKDNLGRLELIDQGWNPAFLEYIKQLSKSKPVIFGGDINVAYTEDDLANPKANRGKKGFTAEERQGFANYLESGFIDSFRQFTSGNGYYTWWSHFAKARERNVGWRIDYFLVDKRLKAKLISANIHPNILGSDHCPVSIELNL